MTKTSETVVFFGSGPVATESLQLLRQKFKIEAVVTKPRPAHHHGRVPVLSFCEERRIPLYTVNNKLSLDELIITKPFQSKLAILVDFGIIVSKLVIDYFDLGIINSHFSLLPLWRGADPITFSILNGERQTGVSLMLLVAKMDEGPLLAQEAYKISKKTTTPQLTKGLTKLSYQLLSKTIPDYLKGSAKPYAQNRSMNATYSRRLTKEDGVLDWSKSAETLEREIRAFIGWPNSRTKLADKEVIITQATVHKRGGKPGSIIVDTKRLLICCGAHSLEIKRLKPAGKREMSASAFLAGYGRALGSSAS